MKKCFTRILSTALSIGMAMFFIISPVLADETDVTASENGGTYTTSSTVSYHVYSKYKVSVPMTISEESEYCAAINVTMDQVEDGKHIDVYVSNLNSDGKITVTSSSGNEAYLTVKHGSNDSDIQSDGLIYTFEKTEEAAKGTTMTENVKLEGQDENLSGGTYTGSIEFRFECNDD